MTQLSPNFTLEELTFSEAALRLGVDNTPDEEAIANLTRLATTILEPMRALLDLPVHINSGYRSFEVNQRVGGATKSAHLLGNAADTVPIGMQLRAAFDKIRASGIPFDQLILECNAWCHISQAPVGTEPRRQALLASGGPGHWTYSLA